MSRTLQRYLLAQFPSWLLAAALAFVLHVWVGLPVWLAVLATAAWIVKDLALYPSLRQAYERGAHGSASSPLVGARGIVTRDVAPAGWVQVEGSLWQARARDDERLERGSRVTVEAVEGLRLVVRPECGSDRL